MSGVATMLDVEAIEAGGVPELRASTYGSPARAREVLGRFSVRFTISWSTP